MGVKTFEEIERINLHRHNFVIRNVVEVTALV